MEMDASLMWGRNKEPQYLYLSPKCRKDSIITHELGHTLGLYHEQARPDRDDHVTVVWENVPAPQSQQFEKFPQSVIRDIGVPYDYLSIMHYGSKAFSMNGDNTIVTSDPKFQDVIGNREILSFRDIKIINILYQCGAKCPGQCPGEGFYDKNCECLCPGDPIQPCSQGGTEQGAGGQLPLGYVPPTPVTILEECFDSNSDCPRWSSEGRCDTASTYMHMYCRKSCRICKEPCVDRHARCRRWAMLGDCDSNPYYMSNYCKLSCNRCGDGNTTSASQICEDISANRCPKWRSLGHCGNPVYAEYMKSHCRKTCQMCHVTPEAVKVEEGNAVHQLVTCADHDPNCEKWVKEGQCEVTPEYMYRFCALSCRACQ